MNIQNPYMSAARRMGDPELNKARAAKWLRQRRSMAVDERKFRLYYGDTPIGMVVTAKETEINAWNKNSRSFFAHQSTIGRANLPLLLWKLETDRSGSVVWRVSYTVNGVEAQRLVSALSKTEAEREFFKTAPVTAVIKRIDEDEDVEGAVSAARAIDGGDGEEDQ